MRASLATVAREWGRIGVIGFGGPPAHVALLRDLCVERRKWIDAKEFEDANAACGLLPGPASTQLAIYCAWRVGGGRGAVLGGLCFIVPGLVLLLALAAVSLQEDPPAVVMGAALGAGAAVVPVIVRAGIQLVGPSLSGRDLSGKGRAVAYILAGFAVVVGAGAWVVLALLACGAFELVVRRGGLLSSTILSVGVGPVAWLAFKVGALSYGGGFVIIPLMQGTAVDGPNAWMTEQEFLNAVALGQITPGPVVQTVGGVGYAAGGLWMGVLAAVIAFAPSFLVILLAGRRFQRLRSNVSARAFLDGAGPAAIGAILGAGIPLLAGVDEAWQWAVLAAAGVALALRRSPTLVLLAAAAVGGIVGVT